jgi:hypothetical protein
LDLATVNIPAVDLFRISKYATGEPHFGRTKANRFDDPARTEKRRFGTCYCGIDLETAMFPSLCDRCTRAGGARADNTVSSSFRQASTGIIGWKLTNS